MNIDEVVYFLLNFFCILILERLCDDKKEKSFPLKKRYVASFVAINYSRGAICLLAPDRLMPRSV